MFLSDLKGVGVLSLSSVSQGQKNRLENQRPSTTQKGFLEQDVALIVSYRCR